LLKILFALACLLSSKVFAFEPLNTDDAATVKAGGNQIEQYFFSIQRHGSTSSAPVELVTPGEEFIGSGNARAFPLTYTRGLTDRVEASFAATYFSEPSGNYSRISNVVLGAKWRFLETEDNQYALAVKPTLTLPSSAQQQVYGLGLAAPNYGVNLIASAYFEDLEIHANGGYMHSPYNMNYPIGQSMDPNRVNIFMLSIAPVWSISSKIKLALDIGATTNPPKPEQYLSNYLLGAVIYSPAEDIDIGISAMRSAFNYGTVISGNGPNATRTEIGVTWRF
jgi:hypothetical protein